jgi:hypothetical protein
VVASLDRFRLPLFLLVVDEARVRMWSGPSTC